MHQSADVTGKEIQALDKSRDRMITAGFEGARSKLSMWPCWPQEDPRMQSIIRRSKIHITEGLENWALRRFTQHMRWSKDEVYMLCASVRQQLAHPGVRACQQAKVVYARKPDHWTEDAGIYEAADELEGGEPFPPWVADV